MLVTSVSQTDEVCDICWWHWRRFGFWMCFLIVFFRHTKPLTFADCIGDELPVGWEEAYDPVVGAYYVDHNTSEFTTCYSYCSSHCSSLHSHFYLLLFLFLWSRPSLIWTSDIFCVDYMNFVIFTLFTLMSWLLTSKSPPCAHSLLLLFYSREHSAGRPAGPVAAGAGDHAAGVPGRGQRRTQCPEGNLPGEGAEAASGAAGVSAAQRRVERQVIVTDELWVMWTDWGRRNPRLGVAH